MRVWVIATLMCAVLAVLTGRVRSAWPEEPARLRLTVLAPGGSTVVAASTIVWQRGKRDTGAVEWTVARGTSDTEGRVFLTGLDASLTYRLEVTPPPTRMDLALLDQGTWRPASGTVQLEHGFTVSGVVKDPL